MNASLIRIAAVLIALSLFVEAQAQQPFVVAPRAHAMHNISPGYYAYPAHGFYPRTIHWSKAATVGESYARGVAAVTRARAEYNVAMAHVRAKDTETRQKRLQYYYQNKETNKQYRDSTRKYRPSSENLTQFAQTARPSSLSPAELDTRTGELSWPELLQSDQFAAYRAELERLFSKVSAEGRFGAAEHEQLQKTADAMRGELGNMVREVKPTDYVEAKRFIESLAFQSREHQG